MGNYINELISKEALDSVNKLEATFGRIVSTIDSLVARSKTLDQLLSTMNKAADAQNALGKASKEAANLNKQLADSEDEVVKAKIRYANAVKEQRTELQAQVTMEKAASDSLAAMKARLADLKSEYNNASAAIRDKMAPALKDLTSQISKAEQATGKHTRGVGDYTNSIKNAVGQIFAIAAPAAAAAFALNGLKEAFAGTEAGANLLGRAKLQMTAFFDAIVEGKWRYAFGNELPKDIKVIGDMMNKLRIDERAELVEVSVKEKEIKDLRIDAIKAGKDSVEQVRILTLAEQKQTELIGIRLEHKVDELEITKMILDKDPVNTTYLNKQAQLNADINGILGDRSLRIASKLEAAQEKTIANAEKEKKLAQETADKEKQIREDATKNNMELQQTSLKGVEAGWKHEVEGEKATDDFKLKEMAILGIKEKDLGLQHNKDLDKQKDERLKADKKESDEELKITEEKFKLAGEIVKGAFSFEEALIERKIQKLEDQKNAELSNANLTAAQKTAINEKYAKKEAELKTKEAKMQKVEALFSIAIDTARAVMAAAKTPPLIPFIIALGAVEAAVVAAKPIPKFAKGTSHAPGGLSIVGEKGSELMINPSGQIGLSPDAPTLIDIAKGTRVFDAPDTRQILAAASISKNNNNDATQERRHKELVNTIKNQRQIILGIGIGHKITERKGNRYTNYFEHHLS